METIEGGFADLVLGAQSVFRAIMDSLARPGSVQSIASDADTLPFDVRKYVESHDE